MTKSEESKKEEKNRRSINEESEKEPWIIEEGGEESKKENQNRRRKRRIVFPPTKNEKNENCVFPQIAKPRNLSVLGRPLSKWLGSTLAIDLFGFVRLDKI